MNHELPVVLVIAGLDPSGGAGIQADIQTLSALQCHCTSVVSTLTTQDSHQLYRSYPITPEIVDDQLRVLEAEFHFSAIKLGALGSADNAQVVAQFIRRLAAKNQYPPIILDPVIKASGGGQLSDKSLQNILLNEITPSCTLITPNAPELMTLTGEPNTQLAANKLAKAGTSVLVTGGHNRDIENSTLENLLITEQDHKIIEKRWQIELIKGEFRGTGCSFSSAIAGYMARGLSMAQSIENAQEFLSHALENAYTLESGQKIPQRTPWLTI